MNDIAALVARLLAARDSHVETSGATAAFAAISGTEIAAVMHSRGPRELTQREQQLLQAPGATTCHERRGALYAGNVPAAATTAVLLPQRLPATVRATLGIAPDGDTLQEVHGVPLSRALTGLGARREPLNVEPTPGQRDPAGHELVISSAARLWLGCPIAIVTEQVYGQFLATFPGPRIGK